MAVGENNPNYVLCSVCGIRRTKKPSGICSRCEKRNPVEPRLCKICGERMTRDISGVCSTCRQRRSGRGLDVDLDSTTRLDNAILIAQRNLRLLVRRKEGASFAQIGKELHISKNAAYGIFTRLVGSPMLNIVDVDGTYLDVTPFRGHSTLLPPRLVYHEEDDSKENE